MQHSRKPSVVSLLDDPRFYNGNGRAIRLPQSYHMPNENEGNPNPPSNPPAQTTKAEVDALVDKRVSEYLASKKVDNDPMAALVISVRAQVVQEERAKAAEAKVVELEAKVPDEATTKALEKLQELGGIEAVEKAINDGKAAIDERDELKRDTVKADVRDVLKVKKSPLFDTLTNGVDFKVTGEVKDGKDERAVVVVSDGKETPWDEYVKGRQDIADALPALKSETPGTAHPRTAGGGASNPQGTPPERVKQGEQASYSTTAGAF